MILLLVLCFAVSLTFESIGVATGIIYGPYHYTDMLGPKFLGLVPYLIPVAWFMMMYPSLVMAKTLTGYNKIPTTGKSINQARSEVTRLPGSEQDRSLTHDLQAIMSTAALGGLIMTAWDLALDPMMVSIGHWVWDGAAATRPYFGVPLRNFSGWWLTTFVVFFLYLIISHRLKFPTQVVYGKPSLEKETEKPSPAASQLSPLQSPRLMAPESFDRLAVLSYLTTALGNIFTALIIGLGGPALAGFFAMSPWIILVWPKLQGQDFVE